MRRGVRFGECRRWLGVARFEIGVAGRVVLDDRALPTPQHHSA